MRADVPVGAYLSGGLDSSIISALAAGMTSQGLRTFSVTFDTAEHDESAFQEAMAAALGTEHRAVACRAGDIARDFPDVVRFTEKPIIRTAPAPLYKLSDLVRETGLKVVLTGEGADEVFAGYDIFKEARVRRFCGRQPGSRVRPHLFRKLYPYLPGLQQQSAEYVAAFFGAGGRCSRRPALFASAALQGHGGNQDVLLRRSARRAQGLRCGRRTRRPASHGFRPLASVAPGPISRKPFPAARIHSLEFRAIAWRWRMASRAVSRSSTIDLSSSPRNCRPR
ncbi:asparagine synthase-related protein [Sinorhizobium medicae]